MHESLIEKKEVLEENKKLPKVDKLTFNLMNNLFKKKYNNLLNEDQNKILHHYANNEDNMLLENFSYLKNTTLNKLNDYIEKCSNKILIEKYIKVKENIKDVSSENITKENLQKYLTIAKLKEELEGEE